MFPCRVLLVPQRKLVLYVEVALPSPAMRVKPEGKPTTSALVVFVYRIVMSVGRTVLSLESSIGATQYELLLMMLSPRVASPPPTQELPSKLFVVMRFVTPLALIVSWSTPVLPQKICLWAAPSSPGKTIGSSVATGRAEKNATVRRGGDEGGG